MSRSSKLQGIQKIINSNTVLWILEILKTGGSMNSFKACVCSLTLLSIVDKNDIAIGHQEQAIIKRFNKVLNGVDEGHGDSMVSSRKAKNSRP